MNAALARRRSRVQIPPGPPPRTYGSQNHRFELPVLRPIRRSGWYSGLFLGRPSKRPGLRGCLWSSSTPSLLETVYTTVNTVKRTYNSEFIDSWRASSRLPSTRRQTEGEWSSRWRRFSKNCKDSGTIGTTCKAYDRGKLIIRTESFSIYGSWICRESLGTAPHAAVGFFLEPIWSFYHQP